MCLIPDLSGLSTRPNAGLYFYLIFLYQGSVLNVGSMIHHQSSTTPILKSISSNNFNTVLFDNEMQTIMDKAKPIVQSVPNYDVGPVLSSTIIEEKSPIKQLNPIEENFNLRPEESHIKPKTIRDDFFRKNHQQKMIYLIHLIN
jgi:hypothetical protein